VFDVLHNTNTCISIQLFHFLKLLSLSTRQCRVYVSHSKISTLIFTTKVAIEQVLPDKHNFYELKQLKTQYIK